MGSLIIVASAAAILAVGVTLVSLRRLRAARFVADGRGQYRYLGLPPKLPLPPTSREGSISTTVKGQTQISSRWTGE